MKVREPEVLPFRPVGSAVAGLLLVVLAGCSWFRDFDFERGARMTGGNPAVGLAKIKHYDCHGCHSIPGVAGESITAPALVHWSRRQTIAGKYPNTAENLTRWIQHPQQLKPGTSMPDMGTSEQDSRDIAAYLYSVR
jgi:cytochrome c